MKNLLKQAPSLPMITYINYMINSDFAHKK